MDELITLRTSKIIDPKSFEQRALRVGRTTPMVKNTNS